MTCPSCASKVSAAVEQVAGVASTDVDLATGTVRVSGERFVQDTVSGAIAALGYQVT